jgi:hypothetical protein
VAQGNNAIGGTTLNVGTTGTITMNTQGGTSIPAAVIPPAANVNWAVRLTP